MSTPKNNKELIGKGLRSLLDNINTELKTGDGNLKSEVVNQVTQTVRIPVSDIIINPKQPRKDFNETALQELAESLKRHNIIQPLTVSKLSNGKYQLVAGERRWRASQIAGLKDVPVYVRQSNDKELLELALLENLQRENLNPMEIAFSYKRMEDELNYTQEEVAKSMGKERSTVSNYIRLLKLPPDIQLAVRQGKISFGHARALINIDTVDRQLMAFHQIIDKGLSVRQTEEWVKSQYKAKSAGTSKKSKELPTAYKKIEDAISSQFSTKAKLEHNSKGHGSITLPYYSLDGLNKLLKDLHITIS
jgi:ParB family chromosome partitioning protein